MDTCHNLAGSEIDCYRCLSALLSLAGGREHILGNYVFSGAPREREGSRLLEFSLELLCHICFFNGVPLQADRVLNACPICCQIGQVTVTFQRVVALEFGAAYQA